MGSISAARDLCFKNAAIPSSMMPFRPRALKGRDTLPPEGLPSAKIIDIREARARLRPETLEKKRGELSSRLDSALEKCEAAIFTRGREALFSFATSIASDASKLIELANSNPGVLTLFGKDSNLLMNFMASLIRELKQTEKGVIRRAAEPPSDHYLMAWVVWMYYLVAYSKAGFRASEQSKQLELHLKSVSGLGK